MQKGFALLSLLSLFLVGCASPYPAQKSEYVTWVQDFAPQAICGDKTIKQCTASNNYASCVKDVDVYKTICTRKSFKTLFGKTDDLAPYEMGGYMGCMVTMFFEDKDYQSVESNDCENIYQNGIQAISNLKEKI